MKINVLSTETANMIAAGEVVERPASVIKELLENSIDAGAKEVTVEIKKGGVPYIRVTDDGCGIESGEVETAFLRHATSKIKGAKDLDSIATLGFRGEALASIAAVSRTEIFTKTASSDVGTLVTIEAGKVVEKDEAGCADGTTIIVRNLFFNTPARMKFLKSDSAETGYITDVINKLVLSHPEVAIKYINNGKTVLTSSGDGKLINAIYSVFGKEYADNMKKISYEDESLKVTGFVGNRTLSRKDRRHQFFFVNSRCILSRLMSSAVSEAFKTTVMTGQFPVCVLKVEVPLKSVDVNVHPAKTEVRFSDEKKIYSGVYWAVKNALTEEKYVPEITQAFKNTFESTLKNAPSYDEAKQINFFIKPEDIKTDVIDIKEKPTEDIKPQAAHIKETEIFKDGELSLNRFTHIANKNVSEVKRKEPQSLEHITVLTDAEATIDEEERKLFVPDVDFKFVGQVFGTYFILQRENEMLIIDQHAAHERICYEELLEEFKTNEVGSQLMLLPVTLTLTASETELIESRADFFAQIGFEIEPFGKNSAIVRATPGTLEEQDIKEIVSDMLTLLYENKESLVKSVYEEALHMIACKKALKGNKTLTETELKALGSKVLSLEEGINTCPHGRPIMVSMTKYGLEKQFKRE